MITLDVKDYCSGCTDFEPVTDGPTFTYLYDHRYLTDDSVVRCRHHDKCQRITQCLEKKYLKDRYKNDPNNSDRRAE